MSRFDRFIRRMEAQRACLDWAANSLALAHVDLGSGDAASSRQLARSIAPHLRQMLSQGGILVSDQDMGAMGGCHWPCRLVSN